MGLADKYRNMADDAEGERSSLARIRDAEVRNAREKYANEHPQRVRQYVEDQKRELPALLEDALKHGRREIWFSAKHSSDTLAFSCPEKSGPRMLVFDFGHYHSEMCLNDYGKELVRMLRGEGFQVTVKEVLYGPSITASF